jgi:Carboxypeptidase regulatory-like domain/TonB-dependent Receptor Plug Domain
MLCLSVRLRRVFLLAIWLVAWPVVEAAAQSQATTAEINGRVVDAQGGALPGVSVTAKNVETGYTLTAVTSGEGLYLLPLLPPGAYDVTMELAGFGSTTRRVALTVGASITYNHTLQLSGVAETLTVTASTPLIETTATVRTTTLNEDAIDNLPINGRRFQDFITLTPTVQVDTQRGQLSFAGQRGINSNVSVDGADYNQPFFGGIKGGERSNTAFTIPLESVQEFQVVAAGYAAEFGRSTGGLVNAITKSGTNTTRGSAVYVNRHRDLAEKNAFGQTAAPTQQQFGGSIGGPLVRDRLFYFAAYEQQLFENTRNVVFNLTGVNPTADTREAYDYYRSLEEPFDTTNDATALLGRVDYQLGSGSRFNIRYNYSRNEALNANATGNALSDTTTSALSNNGTEKDNTSTFVGQYTAALSPTLLFEARGQYAREERPREANALEPTVQTQVGNYGTVNFLGQNIQRDWRAQAAANLTAVKGTHTVKLGTEYNHVDAFQLFGFNQFGRWTVNGVPNVALEVLSVGGPSANRFDVPIATANYLKQLGNLELSLATDELAFFAQDAWRVTPALTLNYGIRWEGAFNPTPQANNDFMLTALNGFTFPSGRTVDPTQIPNQTSQFGPRLGFAWTPDAEGRTVVRGYTGLYYARTPMLLLAAPMNNFRVPPGDLSVQLPLTPPAGNPNTTLYRQLLLIGIDLNQTPLNNLPNLTTEQITQIASALGLTVNPYLGAQPLVVDEDFKNPRATQFGAGFERELATGFTASADFTYVKTDNLQRNREMNLFVPEPRATDAAQRPFFQTPRPNGALGSVQVRESTAESEYTALTLATRVQKAWGQFNVSYVLSKSESDDDNERDSGGAQYENTYDLGSEWAPARLDRRHQFGGYAVFFLPYNFDITSGFRFQSALPIDATMGRDANNDRGGPDRPFSAPGVPFQRNGFRNEPFKEVNLRAQWGLAFADGKRLLFTAELFNVFNWDNILLSGNAVTNYCAGTAPDDCGFGPATNPNFLSLTDNNPTSSTFGQLITTNIPGAPRQVQLGVRFQF